MRLLGWLLLGAIAGAFVLNPDWDLQAAAFLYHNGHFLLENNAVAKAVSKANHGLALLCGGLFALGMAITALRRHPILGLTLPAYGFLLTSLILGPGIITNWLLKDHWGRARPVQVTQFGGAHLFTPAGMITNQCDVNCAFVCGDAAFVFWALAFAYIVPPPCRRRTAMAALALGAADGLLRMTQGGHFLSDVLFAAWIMILTTALCHAMWFGTRETLNLWGLTSNSSKNPSVMGSD